MSFALLKITKAKHSVKKTDSVENEQFDDKLKKIRANVKVSNKFLQVAAATLIFSSALLANANQAKAEDFQVSSLDSKTNLTESVKNTNAYTGLVIVVKSQTQLTTMSPKITTKSGTSVFGDFKNLSDSQADFVINQGIAGFTDNFEGAKTRGGDNPLVIQAESTQDDTNFVISDSDAVKILLENQNSKFLENFKVCFVFQSE